MFLIYRLLMAYKKSGKEVTCNICGRSFNRIRAIGGSYHMVEHLTMKTTYLSGMDLSLTRK